MSPLGIPSEWTYNDNPNASAIQSSIVVPAAAGITHVLTHIKAVFLNQQTNGTGAGVIEVLDGATRLWSWTVFASAAAAGQFNVTDLETDVFLATAPGNALTVRFTGAPPAGFQEALSINGHST